MKKIILTLLFVFLLFGFLYFFKGCGGFALQELPPPPPIIEAPTKVVVEAPVAALDTTLLTQPSAILYYPSFPTPVPLASSTYRLNRNIFNGISTLGSAEYFLKNILSDNGYEGLSYFQVDSKENKSFAGFAIVAQIEQINKDGYSLPAPSRWEVKYNNKKSFSLDNIIEALFGSNPGFYRVLVFHVSDEPLIQEAVNKMEIETAEMLVSKGAKSLHKKIKKEAFNSDYECNLLVYEFEIPESGKKPFLRVPSPHTGKIHIDRSGLEKAIKERVAEK